MWFNGFRLNTSQQIPNSASKTSFFNLLPDSKISWFFRFPEAYFNILKRLNFIITYSWKSKCVVHQISPYHEKSKYLKRPHRFIFNVCKIQAQILPNEFYLFSHFFLSQVSFFISFSVLVRSQAQHLLIKKSVIHYSTVEYILQ